MDRPVPAHTFVAMRRLIPAAHSSAQIFASIRLRLASLSGWQAGLAAALFGALSATALPPYHLVPVLLIAVPGLLTLIDAARGWRGAGWIGFWFGFGHHLVGLYWVTDAILVEAARFWWLVPLAVPLLAATLAIFIVLPCLAAKVARPGWRRVLVFAGTWVLADLARQFIATGFPWNPWGSVWEFRGVAGDIMIQPAAWVGVHGLTLATVLLAATPMLGLRAIGVGGAALALWAGLGVIRLDRPEPPETGLSVVLVQGNVQETDKWSQDLLRQIWMRYLQLTAAGVAKAAGRPSVVVWPETASPALLGVDPEARAAIMQAAAPARAALVGTVRFTDGEPSRAPGNRPLNSLVALVGDGRIAATYDKWHLVPFGEYQPTWFPLPIQVVPGGGFAPGSGPATLQVPGIPPVAPLICYEAIFSAQVVDEADRPAWIVNITNDAWFGNSSGPRQHLAAARMRAVEEGLPLMRAANTGISVGFDAHGHELGRLGIGVTGTLVLPLPGALPPTSFSRWGLVLPGLLALAAIASGLNLGRKRQHPGR